MLRRLEATFSARLPRFRGLSSCGLSTTTRTVDPVLLHLSSLPPETASSDNGERAPPVAARLTGSELSTLLTLAPPCSLSSADLVVPLEAVRDGAAAAPAAAAAPRPPRPRRAALSFARTLAASASRSEAASLACMVAMVSGLCGTPLALAVRGRGRRDEEGGGTTMVILDGVAAVCLVVRVGTGGGGISLAAAPRLGCWAEVISCICCSGRLLLGACVFVSLVVVTALEAAAAAALVGLVVAMLVAGRAGLLDDGCGSAVFAVLRFFAGGGCADFVPEVGADTSHLTSLMLLSVVVDVVDAYDAAELGLEGISCGFGRVAAAVWRCLGSAFLATRAGGLGGASSTAEADSYVFSSVIAENSPGRLREREGSGRRLLPAASESFRGLS